MISSASARDSQSPASSLDTNTNTTQSPKAPTHGIDPVPGYPNADVIGQLHVLAKVPGMQDAVKAILLLKDGEPIPSTIDEASCQKAAAVLLDWGQGRLLCRLAQERPFTYQLNPGSPHQKSHLLDSEQRAQVLADASKSWPQGTPVSLTLCTSLSPKAVKTLAPFLQAATSLGVHIHCDVSTPEALQALSGIRAESVTLQINTTPEEPLREAFDTALVAFVTQSGATKLNVSHASVPAPLAARLLGCRDHWFRADARLEKEVSMLLLMKNGKLKIDQLDVHLLTAMQSVAAPTLRLLSKTGVNTLVVHGALDLDALALTLETLASPPGSCIHRIEACCMLPNTADFEQTLARLAKLGDASRVSHRPMSNAVPGHRPLTDEEAARLAALRGSNSSMAPIVVALPAPQQVARPTAPDPIEKLVQLLMPNSTVDDLMVYRHSPGNATIPRGVTVSNDLLASSHALVDKLRALKAWDTPDDVVRSAVGALLRGAPVGKVQDMEKWVLKALIDVRFPWHASTAPQHLASDAQIQWTRNSMAARVVPVVDTVDRAHSALSAATTTTTSTNVTTTTTTTTTSPITSTNATITDHSFPVQGPRALEELVDPPGPDGLEKFLNAMLSFVEVATFHGDIDRASAGIALVQLLQGKRFDMGSLSPSSQWVVTDILLEERQWKLLAHLVPTHANWQIRVDTPEIASDLAAMKPWPSSSAVLDLTLPSTLTPQAIQAAAQLASTVEPGNLGISIEADADADAASWTALAELLSTCPCALLTIEQNNASPASIDSIAGLLGTLQLGQIGRLELSDFTEVDKPEASKLAVGLRVSGLSELSLVDASDALVRTLATCKPWASLSFRLTSFLAATLKEETIDVQELSLDLGLPLGTQARTANDVLSLHASRHDVLSVVNACKGLSDLELWGTRIGIDDLAHILDGARSITTVRCALLKVSRGVAKKALGLLHQNFSLRLILPPSQPLGRHAGDPIAEAFMTQLLELTVRNQFLSAPDPYTGLEAFTIGAVKGLGLPDDMTMALTLVGHLDGRTAQALSVASKGNFNGSRQHWAARVQGLSRTFVAPAENALPSTEGGAVGNSNPILAIAKKLHRSGTPEIVIGEALGRRLLQLMPGGDGQPPLPVPTPEELDTIPHLIEAMAYMGAVRPAWWLETVFGIERA